MDLNMDEKTLIRYCIRYVYQKADDLTLKDKKDLRNLYRKHM